MSAAPDRIDVHFDRDPVEGKVFLSVWQDGEIVAQPDLDWKQRLTLQSGSLAPRLRSSAGGPRWTAKRRDLEPDRAQLLSEPGAIARASFGNGGISHRPALQIVLRNGSAATFTCKSLYQCA
jgi:hypothetical protein